MSDGLPKVDRKVLAKASALIASDRQAVSEGKAMDHRDATAPVIAA